MKSHATFVFLILVLALTMQACSSLKHSNEKEQKVLIQTTEGDITLKLYNETPLHRNNFIKLVNAKTYNGLLFHRVIKEFMIQGGDPQSKTAGPDTMLATAMSATPFPQNSGLPKFITNTALLPLRVKETTATRKKHHRVASFTL